MRNNGFEQYLFRSLPLFNLLAKLYKNHFLELLYF